MADKVKQTCKKCNKNINLRTQKHIFCEGVCQKVWHVPTCCNVSEKELVEIVKNSDISWFCEPCKVQRRHRRSTMNESIAIASSSPSNSAQNDGRTTPYSQAQIDKPTLKTILVELKALREQQDVQNRTTNGSKDHCDRLQSNIG